MTFHKSKVASRKDCARFDSLPSVTFFVLSALGVAACSESKTEPEPRPGFQFLSGATGADTIEANLSTLLVGELRDASNALVPNTDVFFQDNGLPTGLNKTPVTAASLTFNPENISTRSGFAKTDANGRITARVKLGRGIGDAVIRAGVPASGFEFAETKYTVRPGNATHVRLFPRDTAVYPSARLEYRRTVYDRALNETTGNPTVTYLTTRDLAVSSGAIATPRTGGRDTIIAKTGTYSDTVLLTTVPFTGTLVSSYPNVTVGGVTQNAKGLVVMNLDGSGYKEYARSISASDFFVLNPSWSADKKSIFAHIQVGTDARIWTVPLDATAPKRLVINPITTNEESPYPSADGQWVYFHGTLLATPFDAKLFRVKTDGTGVEQLVPETTLGNPTDIRNMNPRPSPSGVYVAYTGTGNAMTSIRNVLTGQRNAFYREAYSPTWIPNGTRLAYIKGNPGPIYTSEFDGSDERLVTPAFYGGPLSWSPDGKYLLAYRAGGPLPNGFYELIEVATGARLKLPLTLGAHAVLRPYN